MPKSPRKRLEISECPGKNYAVTEMCGSVAGSETYAEAPAKADLWKLVDSDRMDLALPPPKDMVDVGGCCVVCVFAP